MNKSQPARRAITAVCISAAVSTSRRSTPAGVASWTGPDTNSTFAPASAAAAASAKPILPLERLVKYRTGSIGSRVGPAVTITRLPSNTPLRSWISVFAPRALLAAPVEPMTASAISTGSNMRPMPDSPSARAPATGPSTRTPRATKVATLALVAGCCHMRQFIAGATASGASVARQSVDSRSDAWPAASRASASAVAGAISTNSAQRASSRWLIAISASRSQRSLRTGRCDTAWKVRGCTKCWAPAVSTTWTSAPCSRNRRTRSGAL